MACLMIGIAGGSGSGKSTLTKRLQEIFGDDVTVIKHDDYYKALDDMPFEERCKQNYDHPDAYDTPLMIEHLKELKAGRAVECPVYDFKVHNRSGQIRRVEPTHVIVVDGILIFAEPELRRLFDIKLFVDTDADVRVLRRIRRDAEERGRSLDSVINQYLNTVKPMHDAFVEPSKKYADLIIPNGGKDPVVLEILEQRIRRQLQ